MASKTRPPPAALAPYLRLPPETSLITLTATLGCGTSAVWIAARYIAEVLASSLRSDAGLQDGAGGDGLGVVVASWQHDEKFWRGEIRRTTGLDVTKSGGGRLKFLDFLTTNAPLSSMQEIEREIFSALPSSPSSGKKTVLILDNPLLSLLTTTSQQQPQPQSPNLSTLLLSLRSHPSIHSTLLLLPSPSPFPPTTSFDSSIANFTTTVLHASRLVLSCRELETGAAKDVSGVLRITHGGDSDWGQGEEGEAEAELLYLIQRDGVAKVFKRGSGSGGEV